MKNILFLFTVLLSTLTIQAESEAQRIEHYNIKSKLAIQGYDPVAYFSNKATKGSNKYSYTNKSVTYYFSTAANLETFKASPAKYEPQYGGWCAYAFSIGKEKVKINPKSFKIINGKLYLYYNAIGGNTLKKWNEKDDSSQIKVANKIWGDILK